MNGLQFDRENLLLKTEHQRLNVSLYVNNQFDNKIHHLTVDRLVVDKINGLRVWKDPQTDEFLLVTHSPREQSVVATPVAFQQGVVVDELRVEGRSLFGSATEDVQRNMGMRKLVAEQTKGFEDLLRAVERAIQRPAARTGECLCMCSRNYVNWVMSQSQGSYYSSAAVTVYLSCVPDKVFVLNSRPGYLWGWAVIKGHVFCCWAINSVSQSCIRRALLLNREFISICTEETLWFPFYL